MVQIELRHKFESAHRLSTPDSPERCRSIHGHSWQVTVMIAGDTLDENGMLVEFGAFKRAMKRWLDEEVDHALLLRTGDPVIAALRAVQPTMRIVELDGNPTTEIVARWMFRRCTGILEDELQCPPSRAHIAAVHIQENCTNAAMWTA